MSSAPEDSFMSDLYEAKKALDDRVYAQEDYAIVARACAAAQSLKIGLKAGVVVNNLEMQAAFFTALGLPGRPSGSKSVPQLTMPVQQPVVTLPSDQSQSIQSGQSTPHGHAQRHRRRSVASRPQDGLERDHRP